MLKSTTRLIHAQFGVRAPQLDALQKEAESRGLSVSAVVREAIDRYLAALSIAEAETKQLTIDDALPAKRAAKKGGRK